MFGTSKTKAAPTPAEAAASLLGRIAQAVELALADRLHRVDIADALESHATRLRLAHSMR
ncbi:MAG: hypothetical protein ABSG53_07145 [Thermoguttaceae bacterium]|jgi:hypothetical protein